MCINKKNICANWPPCQIQDVNSVFVDPIKKIPQQAGIHSALISGFRFFYYFYSSDFLLHNWNLLGRIYLLTKVIGILGVFL